jgi:hypothetical protein
MTDASPYDRAMRAFFPYDPAILAELRRELAGLDELWRRRETTLRALAAPGSLAAADAPLPDARFVSMYAGQALGTALDHLAAWRSLLNGPTLPMVAHLTLIRGSLEGAVRCRWHVDPTKDAGTRVGRGFAARRADQVERSKYEASKEAPPGPERTSGKSAIERLAELDDPDAVRARDAAGIGPVGYTKITNLMIDYGLERPYRLASALAHGQEWPLLTMHVLESGRPASDPKVQEGILTASEPAALELTLTALGAVRVALEDLEAYRSRAVLR